MSKVESMRLPVVNPNLKELLCFMRDFWVPPRCERDLRSFRGLRNVGVGWQCASMGCVQHGLRTAWAAYSVDCVQHGLLTAWAAYNLQERGSDLRC